jgi:hypothetical protein
MTEPEINVSRVTTEPVITAPQSTTEPEINVSRVTTEPEITAPYGVTEPDTSATADLPFKGDINFC